MAVKDATPRERAAKELPAEALPLRSPLLSAPPRAAADARRLRRRTTALVALLVLGSLPVLAVTLRWLPTDGPGRLLYALHDHVVLPLGIGPFERARPFSFPVAIWLGGALAVAAAGWVRNRSIFHGLQVALTRHGIARANHQRAIRRFAAHARRFGLTSEQIARIARHDERALRERIARALEAGHPPDVASAQRLERLAALAAHLERAAGGPRRRLATAAELHRALLWIELAHRARGDASDARAGDGVDELRELCRPVAEPGEPPAGPFAARLLLHDLASLWSRERPAARALRLGLRERRRVLADALRAVGRARDADEASRAGGALPTRAAADLAIGLGLDVAARLGEPEQARSFTTEIEALTLAATLAGVDAPWLDALSDLPRSDDRRLLAVLLAERDRELASELAAIAARGRSVLGEEDLARLGEDARLERMAAGEGVLEEGDPGAAPR